LERTIRYALNHSRTLAALRKSEQGLRVLSAKLVEAQENERKTIAQEIHDSIGASLTAIRYGLEEKLYNMRKGISSPDSISLEKIIEIVAETVKETHRISVNLRPSILDDMGLVASIRSLCREFQGIHKDIHIETDIDLRDDDVEEPLRIVIYRILQEALNNVLKHSNADSVQVGLGINRNSLVLTIKDNGMGFDPCEEVESEDKREDDMGLLGMKERTELSDGKFMIESEEGQGTFIKAEWPLDYSVTTSPCSMA